jgi:hypothetical protein
MFNGGADVWYCDNIVAGPWPFLLLLLPLAGAYYYGRKQHRRGWMMIGVWIPIQLALSFTNNLVVSCPQLDMPISTESPQQ